MRETIFVWDSVNDCVMSELDGSGAVQVTYTNEPQQYGGVISQRRGTTTSTYHSDALGSTRALTDSSGNVTDTYLHDAWGNLVASTGTTTNPFKWVGKYGYYTDDSTGPVYVRARMYEPTVARWMSVDPLRFVDGSNYYLYAINRPVFLTDANGEKCRIDVFGVRGQHTYIRDTVQPEEDPYFPASIWKSRGTHYEIKDFEFPVTECDGCQMTIEVATRAQRFYRFINGIFVNHRGEPSHDENDPRDFASLLIIKVCYTNIDCGCGATLPDHAEEWEHLFYTNGLGTYIQYGNQGDPPPVEPGKALPGKGLRQAAADYIPPVPPCDVGADYLYWLRTNSHPGDEQRRPTHKWPGE